MKFIIDKRVKEILNIDGIVFSILKDIDINCSANEHLEKRIKEAEKKVSAIDVETLELNSIIEGYRFKIQKMGRSLKKYPPAAIGLINNIKKRGYFPRINIVVDMYNLATLNSMLSIGAHDLDSINGDVKFTFADIEDKFTAIGGSSKPIHIGDFIYRDDDGIMEYLDARDGEKYKIHEKTKNVLLIIQGNENAFIEMTKNILEEVSTEINNIAGGYHKTFFIKSGEVLDINI